MSLEFWKLLFEWGGVVLLALTVFFGAGALMVNNRMNVIQGKELDDFKLKFEGEQQKTALAQKEAAEAKKLAGGFELDIAAAKQRAAEANERAAKAEENLGATKKSAAEANERAANAEKQAGSFQLQIAQANERAANAQLELARLKTPRSLIRIPELVAALQPFKETEYVFVSVFQDDESMLLLRAIHEALQKAGWKRGKSVPGYPGVNMYGKDVPDFTVPIGFNSGISIVVQSPQSLDNITELKDFPPYVQAAIALNLALPHSISPVQDNSVGKMVNSEAGTSTVVRIAVGRKP